MMTHLRSFLALAALFATASCEKPSTPPVVAAANPAEMQKTQAELASARDALQRQALEIDTKTALMDKQLAEMTQVLKDRENAELRGSLDALKKQNDELRTQADAARRQSNAIAQKAAPLPRQNSAPAVSPASDYSLFYDRLAPYGRWFDVSGYGYCWQPSAATSRWRPYVDGCWAWSSLGWTWQSNEPFGWATYHYGRWVNLSRHGWVWVPGVEWAPAWVSWRQSRDYVGWAPLPPERGSFDGVYRDCDSRYNLGPSSYTFITTNHFTQPSYTSFCAPVTRNTAIFQSSVNVTQIVRCDDRPERNVFKHHGGPPRAQMERANASQVPQMQVRTASADQIPPHERGHRREERLSPPVIIDLPVAKTGEPPVRPQIVEHIDKPRRVDAFEGVPQRMAEKIRETIAAEKASAVVQQQPVVAGPTPPAVAQPEPAPAPVVPPAVTQETVRAATADEIKLEEARPDRHGPESRPAADPVAAKPVVVEKPSPPRVEMPAPSSQPVPAVAAEVSPAAVETTTPQSVAAEKMAAEQAQAAAEVERVRQQAEAAAMQRQQEEQAAQQRAAAEKMAAEQAQAAAEAERGRQQAEAAAMQRQQEEQAAQQRAAAEKMAAEQAQAAAEAERARQQEEAARRAQEMAQRQAEEQARRAQEEQIRQQEMAMRAAQEEARRQAEAELRRAQEMAQRQAEEQARRAVEEQMRRAQEEAQRAAQEAARRAAEEAARNQPQPPNPGS
ncbi:MAG: hypothetical protein JNM65_10600 [Verrucomicrobiaceae bacterium]|nr:hypothetical protein [Verrucomicrobiaceae bacterium]